MPAPLPSPTALESAVRLIQVALTPVFLLSGIAALLNVFATRLGRVSDRLEQMDGEVRTAGAERSEAMCAQAAELRRRSRVLDWAVVLGALAATATCAAILALFLGSLMGAAAAASVLIILFGSAVLLTMGSVAAFGSEMLLASRAVRLRAHVRFPALRRRERP